MLISEAFALKFNGRPANMRVIRNDGYCWGRLICLDGTEFDVSTARDHYDDDDDKAARAFIRAAQRGNVDDPSGWEGIGYVNLDPIPSVPEAECDICGTSCGCVECGGTVNKPQGRCAACCRTCGKPCKNIKDPNNRHIEAISPAGPIPSCLASMGCLCAGHAGGLDASDACNAVEAHCGVNGCQSYPGHRSPDHDDGTPIGIECGNRTCHALAVAVLECCGRVYARCGAHGGLAGATRSRGAHRGLHECQKTGAAVKR